MTGEGGSGVSSGRALGQGRRLSQGWFDVFDELTGRIATEEAALAAAGLALMAGQAAAQEPLADADVARRVARFVAGDIALGTTDFDAARAGAAAADGARLDRLREDMQAAVAAVRERATYPRLAAVLAAYLELAVAVAATRVDGSTDVAGSADVAGSVEGGGVVGEGGGLDRSGWVALGRRVPRRVLRRWVSWLGDVNPWRGIGGDWLTQCVLAAIALDMASRDGVGYQAPPEKVSPVVWLENYAGRSLVDVAGFAAVQAALAASPVGSRGFVVFTNAGGGGQHVVNVMHHRRLGVVFLDGQSGGQARGPRVPGRVRFVATTDGVVTPKLAMAPQTAATGDADVAGMDSSAAAETPGGGRRLALAAAPDVRGGVGVVRFVAERPVPRFGGGAPRYLTESQWNVVDSDGLVPMDLLARGDCLYDLVYQEDPDHVRDVVRQHLPDLPIDPTDGQVLEAMRRLVAQRFRDRVAYYRDFVDVEGIRVRRFDPRRPILRDLGSALSEVYWDLRRPRSYASQAGDLNLQIIAEVFERRVRVVDVIGPPAVFGDPSHRLLTAVRFSRVAGAVLSAVDGAVIDGPDHYLMAVAPDRRCA